MMCPEKQMMQASKGVTPGQMTARVTYVSVGPRKIRDNTGYNLQSDPLAIVLSVLLEVCCPDTKPKPISGLICFTIQVRR